jgi:DNA repair exonuclease SbcCD ATPase subunit
MAPETKQMIELRRRIACEERRMRSASVGSSTRRKAMARYRQLRRKYRALGGTLGELRASESQREQKPKKPVSVAKTGVVVGTTLAASLLSDARRAKANWREATQKIKETEDALTRLEEKVAESVAHLSELI